MASVCVYGIKWTLLIKALLEGGRDGGRFEQTREGERFQSWSKTRHPQLLADKPREPGPHAESGAAMLPAEFSLKK